LQDLALDPPTKKQKKKEKDHIVLSTIHSSKGMEFDQVFLIKAQDGSIPKQTVNHQKVGTAADVEEELRLLYVAVTRARYRLTISHVNAAADISRFLRDIPQELVEWV